MGLIESYDRSLDSINKNIEFLRKMEAMMQTQTDLNEKNIQTINNNLELLRKMEEKIDIYLDETSIEKLYSSLKMEGRYLLPTKCKKYILTIKIPDSETEIIVQHNHWSIWCTISIKNDDNIYHGLIERLKIYHFENIMGMKNHIDSVINYITTNTSTIEPSNKNRYPVTKSTKYD